MGRGPFALFWQLDFYFGDRILAFICEVDDASGWEILCSICCVFETIAAPGFWSKHGMCRSDMVFVSDIVASCVEKKKGRKAH
jgi:hypothetical protein